MRCSNCAIKLDEYDEDSFILDCNDETFCSKECKAEYEDPDRDREEYDE